MRWWREILSFSVITVMLLFRIDCFQVYRFYWAVVIFRKACRILNENININSTFDSFIYLFILMYVAVNISFKLSRMI
jgi:hypothetical protein